MEYFIMSVGDDQLKTHIDYKRLSLLTPGEPIIEERDDENLCVGMGKKGDDNRWYFLCPKGKLEETVSYLIGKKSRVTNISVNENKLTSLPENLKGFMRNLEKILRGSPLKEHT